MVTSSDSLLTIKEAAKVLKVHWQSVRTYITSGKLLSSRIGRGIRIRQTDLNNFIANKSPKTESPEVEIRYLCSDRQRLEKKLLNLGAKVTYQSHLVDHWFTQNHVRSLQENSVHYDDGTGFGLRVREQENNYSGTTSTSLEVKRLTDALNHNTCIEGEIPVSDFPTISNLLKLMNFKEYVAIDKDRIIYTLDDIKVAIDEIKHFGAGVEIEIKRPLNRNVILRRLRLLAHKLGLNLKDEIETSLTYLAMTKLARF